MNWGQDLLREQRWFLSPLRVVSDTLYLPRSRGDLKPHQRFLVDMEDNALVHVPSVNGSHPGGVESDRVVHNPAYDSWLFGLSDGMMRVQVRHGFIPEEVRRRASLIYHVAEVTVQPSTATFPEDLTDTMARYDFAPVDPLLGQRDIWDIVRERPDTEYVQDLLRKTQ